MMGFIGKVLVLLYGTLSLFCLIIAIAIYTQQMDFVTPKGENSKKALARIDKSIEKTNELLRANNRAYTRWIQEYDEVVRIEVEQVQRRDFYRGQLELVTTGKLEGEDVKDPVQQLPERDPNTGLLAIDKATGRPPIVVKPMQNAEPQSKYLERIAAAGLELGEFDEKDKPTRGLLKDVHDKIKEHKKVTLEINGDAMTKGLRTKINEQIDIAERADNERIYLDDPITNRRADAQLFVKRRDSLQSRVQLLFDYYKRKTGAQGN